MWICLGFCSLNQFIKSFIDLVCERNQNSKFISTVILDRHITECRYSKQCDIKMQVYLFSPLMTDKMPSRKIYHSSSRMQLLCQPLCIIYLSNDIMPVDLIKCLVGFPKKYHSTTEDQNSRITWFSEMIIFFRCMQI